MKANLPQAEPKMLARWEEEDLYGQIRAVARRAGPPTSCTTARPTPTATSTSGTAFNKILKDFIVKSKTMAGFDSPYVPGLGLPRPAHRNQSRSANSASKKAQMTAVEIRARLPQVRREVRRSAAQGFQAPGRLRPLGRSLPHDERRSIEAVIAGAFVDFLDQGLRLQRPEAGELVHPRPHRAGRSRSGIREPHQPFDLGAFRADLRSRGDRSRAGRPARSTA